MKTKVVVIALFQLLASSLFAGGPRIGITVGTQGWCPPMRPICPPLYCPPVVYRSYSSWYANPPVAYYNWGPSVVVSSSGSGFSNISPVMSYQSATPVYRVPAPVIQAQPVTVYPNSSFGWRR